jgi:CheY-like chemotaxis protein
MKILIVDDHEENLCLLRTLLEGRGHEVVGALNGVEALELARRAPPDLIVSDLLMPVMDGYTLLRQWKADERLKTIPFVVYTATYTEPQDERLALDLGADAFIVKPAEPNLFMESLASAMNPRGNAATSSPAVDEETVLREYNQTLVRKLS